MTGDQIGALCGALPFISLCVVYGLGLLAGLDQPARAKAVVVARKGDRR